MTKARNASLAAAAVAGAASAAAGIGYLGARRIIAADRKRHGVTGNLSDLALDALADSDETTTASIPTADGGRMYVRSAGTPGDPPIVLLHGVTLDGSIWHNQFADLQRDFHVIAPDWRGHGRSTPGRHGFGLDALATDLNTLLETLDLHDALVVGHSMGGMALMRFCAVFPETLESRVSGMAFQSTAVCDVGAGPLVVPLKVGSFLARRFPGAAGRFSKQPADIGYVGARLGFGANPSPVWVEQTRLLLHHMDPAALTASVLPLLDHDERESLRRVVTPALVLVGSADLVTPLRQAEEIAAILPNSMLSSFGGAGHTLMLERSTELSNVLRNFALDCRRDRRLNVGGRRSEGKPVAPGAAPVVALS